MPLTDEDAALQAIATLTTLSPAQQEAQSLIDNLLATQDPVLDIHTLVPLYNTLYFRSLLLPRVEVSWSSRLTLCAGICELVRDPSNNKKCNKIRLKLSEPLLKYRPRSDVLNTLLHEMTHAYFFITTSWKHTRGDDGTGHGAGFLLLTDAINSHNSAYEITVFHTFHDEVESYRTHVWQCDGKCREKAPFWGWVKRATNRAPGRSDNWWAKHEEECGGVFAKIAAPEMTREQKEKLSGLERAGLQKNKIEGWVVAGQDRSKKRKPSLDGEGRFEGNAARGDDFKKRLKKPRTTVSCPICQGDLAEEEINAHLDERHPS